MIGKYTAKVDDKGRLFVPAKLRAELCDAMEMTGCASLSDIDWTKVCYE